MSVFGSAARTQGSPRDLDIAVESSARTDPDALGLRIELVEVTGVEAVDPMDLGRAGHVARERALVGSVALYDAVAGDFARAQSAAVASRMDTDWMRRLDLELMAR